MISVTLSNLPCLNAADEAMNLVKLNKPVPANFPKCNSLINPLGRESASCHVLILRRDLNSLDLNALQTLVLSDGTGNTIPAYSLVITKEPINLTPSDVPNDPSACFLVELSDARWRVHNPTYSVPCNKQYNVRAPGYGGAASPTIYYADTLQSGSAWTWLAMVQDLWGLMSSQLGTAPVSLPAAPSGTPEGWVFPGIPAWEALSAVLERIGCAVRWDPTQRTNQYGIVQVGAADPVSTALLARMDAANRKIHDVEAPFIIRGKEAYGCRVYFHRLDLYHGSEETVTRITGTAWQPNSVYPVDVLGPDIQKAEPNTLTPIWDDLPAIYDSTGTLTNLAALQARAAERAADYYRQIKSVGPRFWKIYSGLVPVIPSGTVNGVGWRQDDQGALITEVIWRRIRINDSGGWEADVNESTSAQPPWFAPTNPMYPPLYAIVQVVGSTPDASGRFDAVLTKPRADVLSWPTKESIWAVDLNGVTTLGGGPRYPATLMGYNNGRLTYQIMSPGGTSNTFNEAVTFNDPVTFNVDASFYDYSSVSVAFNAWSYLKSSYYAAYNSASFSANVNNFAIGTGPVARIVPGMAGLLMTGMATTGNGQEIQVRNDGFGYRAVGNSASSLPTNRFAANYFIPPGFSTWYHDGGVSLVDNFTDENVSDANGRAANVTNSTGTTWTSGGGSSWEITTTITGLHVLHKKANNGVNEILYHDCGDANNTQIMPVYLNGTGKAGLCCRVAVSGNDYYAFRRNGSNGLLELIQVIGSVLQPVLASQLDPGGDPLTLTLIVSGTSITGMAPGATNCVAAATANPTSSLVGVYSIDNVAYFGGAFQTVGGVLVAGNGGLYSVSNNTYDRWYLKSFSGVLVEHNTNPASIVGPEPMLNFIDETLPGGISWEPVPPPTDNPGNGSIDIRGACTNVNTQQVVTDVSLDPVTCILTVTKKTLTGCFTVT